MQLLGLGSVIVAAGIPEAVNVHLRQYYSTDSAAFNQVAARVLLHGHNPYTTTMASAARLLQVPAHNWTYTVNGGHVTSLSYPAGSFLFQVPAMALGFHHQIVDWMDLYAWLITGVLLFVLIPASVRWLAALLILTPIFVQMFSAGGTDAAFVPFLILAVWRWDRFHLGRSAGVASWIGPIALGLACSIKQTPWFCLPFLVVGLFIEAREHWSPSGAAGDALPRHRCGRLRRREHPVHRVATNGMGAGNVSAVHRSPRRRWTGLSDLGPARGRTRGFASRCSPLPASWSSSR